MSKKQRSMAYIQENNRQCKIPIKELIMQQIAEKGYAMTKTQVHLIDDVIEILKENGKL